jgi:hypothetical protein
VTFTNQNSSRSPLSPWVCEPCVHICAWNAPPDRPAPPGAKKGPNFANFSHLLEQRPDGSFEYASVSKGDKPKIREWIRRRHSGPWFAAIGESGQKHVVFRTPVNPAGYRRARVAFEEQLVQLPDEAGLAMLDEMEALLTSGVTKEELGQGDYSPMSLGKSEPEILAFEGRWSHLRGGAWWALAHWLAQRDEAASEARQQQERTEREAKKAAEKVAAKQPKPTKPTPKKRSPDAASPERCPPRADAAPAEGDPPSLPADARGQHPEALGPTAGPRGAGGEAGDDGGRVADGGEPQPAPRPAQLSLF